jgi:hypothetical protein
MKRFLILFCLCAGLVRGEDLPSGRVFANLSDPSIRTDYNFGPGTVKFDRIEGSTVVFKVQVPVSGSSWHPDVRAYLYSPYGVFTPSGSANVVAQTGLPSANVTGEVNGSGTISVNFGLTIQVFLALGILALVIVFFMSVLLPFLRLFRRFHKSSSLKWTWFGPG